MHFQHALPMPPPPTMADIAKTLGINKSTVSRALRGDSRVKAATRERIVKEAERLGYQLDPALSALAEARWRKGTRSTQRNWAALITPEYWEIEGRQTHHQLEELARQQGYVITRIEVNASTSPKVFNRQLLARGVSGVLLLPVYNRELAMSFPWAELNWKDYCWVQIKESFLSSHAHRVLNNTFSNTLLALGKMVELGFQRIAFIREPSSWSRVNIRQQAAFLQFEITHPEISLLDVTFSDSISRSGAQNEAMQFRPDALLLSYSNLLTKLDSSLRDLPFASLYVNDPNGGEAGVYSPIERIYTEAVNVLEHLSRRRETDLPEYRKTTTVDGVWVQGSNLNRKEFHGPRGKQNQVFSKM